MSWQLKEAKKEKSMLLTLTNTQSPATDLGFLLHKHPQRVQHYPLNFGTAQVFYPEADEARCTICLLVDIDLAILGAAPALVGKLAIGGFALALIETVSAKMRIFRAPEFLGTAFLLAVLAMLVHLLLGS